MSEVQIKLPPRRKRFIYFVTNLLLCGWFVKERTTGKNSQHRL